MLHLFFKMCKTGNLLLINISSLQYDSHMTYQQTSLNILVFVVFCLGLRCI